MTLIFSYIAFLHMVEVFRLSTLLWPVTPKHVAKVVQN